MREKTGDGSRGYRCGTNSNIARAATGILVCVAPMERTKGGDG